MVPGSGKALTMSRVCHSSSSAPVDPAVPAIDAPASGIGTRPRLAPDLNRAARRRIAAGLIRSIAFVALIGLALPGVSQRAAAQSDPKTALSKPRDKSKPAPV